MPHHQVHAQEKSFYNTIRLSSQATKAIKTSLGEMPLLLALCTAHWYSNLSHLARYDEFDLSFQVLVALRIFILYCSQVRPFSSVLQ